MSTCIALMTRAPIPGEVKSRIAAEWGEAAALALHVRLLARVLEVCRASGFPVLVHYAGPCTKLLRRMAGPDTPLLQQHGAELGARMHHAFALMHQTHQRVLMVGSDATGLTVDHLRRAERALETSDAVLTPAPDGGYVLVGSARAELWRTGEPFRQARLGSGNALADTLAGLQRLGAGVTMLESLPDVDTVADVELAVHSGWLDLSAMRQESKGRRAMTDVREPDMDQELLSELKDIMGADFTMLVESWRRDTGERVAAMEAAVAGGDGAQLRQVAHSLKGSSANLGARDVVNVCLRLEEVAVDGEMDAADALLAQLRQAVAAADSVLRTLAAG